MKVCFDTTILVASMVKALGNHEAAMEGYLRWTGAPHHGCCTTHALAECYATLTALPLPKRIHPLEARLMIEENLVGRLEILEADRGSYLEAIHRTGELGGTSGMVYDAIHLVVAEGAGCQRLLTYNLRHFRRLGPRGIEVAIP